MSTKSNKVRVLIVDDSKSEQQFLKSVLCRDDDIEVVGMVSDGEMAIVAATSLRPNVITVDLNMPGMNGLDVTRHLMLSRPVPIIIVTADRTMNSAEKAFKLVEAGAVGLVEKPKSFAEPEHEEMRMQLCRLIKTMAEVKLVTRKGTRLPSQQIIRPAHAVRCIVIGASTGGPAAIKYLLENISAPLPVPIFVVQHMSNGFMAGFVRWLDSCSKIKVKLAEHNELIQSNCVYVAPDNAYMSIAAKRITIIKNESNDGRLRTVSHLFRRIAEGFNGSVLAIILSGMGNDGSAEMKLLSERGDITIAQDKASSVVHGMPGEALRLKAAQHEMNPAQMVDFINEMFKPAGEGRKPPVDNTECNR